MFFKHIVSSKQSQHRTINESISLRQLSAFLFLMLLSLSNAVPILPSSATETLESVERRSIIGDDQSRLCYPKSTEAKISYLSESTKAYYSLKIMKLTVDNAPQHVGVLPAALSVMTNSKYSSCIKRSVVLDVPNLFPGKIMMTECDTQSDGCTGVANDVLRINVLKKTTSCDSSNEETWARHNIEISQCRIQ